mgnify:CR=1 FL=1
MMKNLNKKTAWLLVLILVLNMFVIPETAEAVEITDNTRAGSYIKV